MVLEQNGSWFQHAGSVRVRGATAAASQVLREELPKITTAYLQNGQVRVGTIDNNLAPLNVFRVAQRPDSSAPKTDFDPFEDTVVTFENNMALDTVRNEMRFHTLIHAAFARQTQGDFSTLNRKIYDRLFLTPRSDSWLGLKQEGVYSALPQGGLIQKTSTP